MQDLQTKLQDAARRWRRSKVTKRDLVVVNTRHHRARLLKYYPRRPCAPGFVKSRTLRPIQTHFLLFQQQTFFVDLLPDYHATRTVQYKNILNCFNLHQHVQRPTCVNRHRYLRLESLSKDVFERRRSTRIEVFSLTICLDAKKFVLISFFSLIRTIYLRVSTKPPPNDAKRPLPFDVRRSKTLLHKLPVDSPREYDD